MESKLLLKGFQSPMNSNTLILTQFDNDPAWIATTTTTSELTDWLIDCVIELHFPLKRIAIEEKQRYSDITTQEQ